MRALFITLLLLRFALPATSAEPAIDFNRDIRPILSNKCVICHGPDPEQRPTELRLDVPESATAMLESGVRAIIPGKPAESELIARITTDDIFTQMPPADSNKPLTKDEIALLTRWVAEGAEFAPHWAYVPPKRAAIPAVNDAEWCRNPIDRFVLARLEREGLAPAPEASRYTLARRVALDLTGLPPSWPDVKAFAEDHSPRAYERLVDRLLASPAYGEKRARKWLDLARYADSAGYADDPPRTIWAFRDYVIRSYNENKPFDQFTIEQIAGDLLPDPSTEQLVATAFHRNTMTNSEGGTIDEEFRNVAVVDRVNTTMEAWMGTTMACAQCHTHKYDPLTQTEYFEMFAFFNNTADADVKDERPFLEVYSPENRAQRSIWDEELREINEKLSRPTPQLLAGMDEWQETLTAPFEWHALTPQRVETRSGAVAQIGELGRVRVPSKASTDSYTLTYPLTGEPLTGIRLETLPDASLPGGGAGHGAGNFVVSRISARIAPAEPSPRVGRFVRIELPGKKKKTLSLAEVEVFVGGQNIAKTGTATQTGTELGGDAKRAIDGNTDGIFDNGSTTHTVSKRNPGWEVDLGQEQPIERIAIWNRAEVPERLKGARVQILDAKRAVVFETILEKAPAPSQTIATDGTREISFSLATASFAQENFPAKAVLTDAPTAETGWAVVPRLQESHALTLVIGESAPPPAVAILTVTIAQDSKYQHHTLGQFRILGTSDPRAAQRAGLPKEIQDILARSDTDLGEEQRQMLANYYLTQVAPELQSERERKAELVALLAAIKPLTTVPVLEALPEDQRRETHLQHRGSYLDLGDQVEPGVPEIFAPLPEGVPRDRLALAKWLVDEENPLTARVAVNRMWSGMFGSGLVLTSEDFGTQGELPSHPELLDWLAVEFMESGWDQKALLRLIVTSAAYRQSAATTPEVYQQDPANRLLARGPRFRLSAETIRDQALSAAGLLSRSMHGEPVRPPQPELGLTAAFGGSTDWKTSEGEDRYRRGLYTSWRRSNPYPSMTTFDAPTRQVCTIRRPRTNTPLQALVTLNDPVYVEAAQALARRMAGNDGTLEEKAAFGLELCVLRPAKGEEVAALAALYQEALADYEKSPEAALKLATIPLGPLPEGADAAEYAAWTVVGNVLLNLDELLAKP